MTSETSLGLTEALATELLKHAEKGIFKSTVADLCGVSEGWLDDVLRLGQTAGAPSRYVEFARAYVKAEAGGELKVMSAIELAVAVDPQVGFGYLERRFPRKWGKNATQNQTAAELRPTELELEQQKQLMRDALAHPPDWLREVMLELGYAGEPLSRPGPQLPAMPSKALTPSPLEGPPGPEQPAHTPSPPPAPRRR